MDKRARILIAGTHSGCGKTTVTCALLAAFRARGMDVCALKCGPDYIDPMFHRELVGVRAHNLDPFFCGAEQLRGHLARHAGEISVVEGVMGYYDGIGPEGRAGTYDVARATDTPAVLVVNVKGMYSSAGAILRGFAGFKPESGIRGAIFNGCSPSLYADYAKIAQAAGVRALGFLPQTPEISVGSRNLGLITAGEIADLREKLDRLGALAEQYIDIEGVLALAASAPALEAAPPPALSPAAPRVRIAVAKDEAFCFLYQENLELLGELGCEPVFFSPMRGAGLPENIGGLYLPGGYPELHLEALSENAAMRRAVKEAVEGGLTTIAECGGFLYLHDTLDGFPMADVIHAPAYKTEKLQRFGYVTLRATADNLLCGAGESIRAHEFHYYDSADNGNAFLAAKASTGKEYACSHASATLYAGFPHLYFPANPAFAANFVKKAAQYVRV